MNVLSLNENVLNIQKCLLPENDFLRKNHGRYCMITIPGNVFSYLVKIGLCNPKDINDGCFFDKSVVVYPNSDRSRIMICINHVDFSNFRVLHFTVDAIRVTIKVVFIDVYHLKCHSHVEKLKRICKELLKFYVFTRNSVINLGALTKSISNSLRCIDIIDINGDKPDDNNETPYICVDETEVVISECLSSDKYEASFTTSDTVKLGGLNRIYEILKEIVEYSKIVDGKKYGFKVSNKLLLSGPSGCGKTSLVHKIVRDSKTILIEILLPEICLSSPEANKKRLRSVFDRAKTHAENGENCVILIEDVDVLCSGRIDDASLNVRRVMNQLITLLEDVDNYFGIVVIGTTTNLSKIDSQLRRAKRFDDELEIVIPSEEEKEEIICNILEYFKVKLEREIVKRFARWTPGFVGADLYLAIQECIVTYQKMKGNLDSVDTNLFENCFKKVLSHITPTSLKGSFGFQIRKDMDFSKIGGLDDVKKILDYSVTKQLLYPEQFTRMGIPLTKGILLYGPPGCAKTTLVRALAKESNMTFLAASSADLFSPYFGEAEGNIRKLFSQARMGAPAIIFIDEIDGLVGNKSGDRMKFQTRILSTFLVEMDGVDVKSANQRESALKLLGKQSDEIANGVDRNRIIVVGATNRPERLDDALRRPGRFDKMVYVPPPDEKQRLNILQKLTENISLSDDVDLEKIASVTHNYSGADLKNLCYESALLALTETEMKATCVDHKHFVDALEKSRPCLNESMIKFYENFRSNIR